MYVQLAHPAVFEHCSQQSAGDELKVLFSTAQFLLHGWHVLVVVWQESCDACRSVVGMAIDTANTHATDNILALDFFLEVECNCAVNVVLTGLEPATSCNFQYTWFRYGASDVCRARPTAPPPDQQPILWLPEHCQTLKKPFWSAPKWCRAEWRAKRIMCINRWCSEKPEKTPLKLTTLRCLDGAEVAILCSQHNFKQTQRGDSIAAAV